MTSLNQTPDSPEDAAAKLAEIRVVLDAFEPVTDDPRFALDQIQDVVDDVPHPTRNQP